MNSPSSLTPLPSLSVVMPALNEESNIGAAISSVLAAFDARGIEGEIVAVNDGSRDGTGAVMAERAAKDKRVRIVTHVQNQGIGRSFLDGVVAAKKDAVVMLPGDNENDPREILKYLSLMSQVDIVVPFIHNAEVRNRFRRLISSLYRFIINMSFGINLNYTNGTVIYRRAVLDDVALRSAGFFYQAELLVKLIRKGYLYAEVPNFLGERKVGKSKAVTLRSFVNVMRGYLSLAFRIHVVRIESGDAKKRLTSHSVTHARYQELAGGQGDGA